MKYSGLMSVYKKENPVLFKDSLTSILNQTQQPAQMVIVKDGDLTEKLLEVIREMQFKFEKNGIYFKVISNEKNLGLGLSLRKGVQNCDYDWIARFDSDDVSVNYRMQDSINFIHANPSVKLVGGYVAEVEKSHKDLMSIRKVPNSYSQIKKMMFKRNPFNHMTVFFERDTILDAGNYMDVPYFEDYYLWLRVLKKGANARNINKVLVKANVDNNFLNKRGGIQYLKKEYNFQKIIYKEGYTKSSTFALNLLTRGLVRMLPKKVLKRVYSIIRKQHD